MLSILRKIFVRLILASLFFIRDEIEKLLDVDFICPIDYPPWISNIVVISKGKNKIRMCTNFF